MISSRLIANDLGEAPPLAVRSPKRLPSGRQTNLGILALLTIGVALMPRSAAICWSGETPPSPSRQPGISESLGGEASLRPLSGTGLENLYQYAEGLFGGSEPTTDVDFVTLANLGVKTILSVDGAQPKVEQAARHGLQYFHIPIGYDGLPEAARKRLAKATRGQPGPFFVHCHHGLHRGPAALACLEIANGKIQPEQGLAWLHRVGTSPDYHGLYRDVAASRFISDDELADVPSPTAIEAVSDMAETMAELDRIWDRLTQAQAGRWKPSDRIPNRDPAHDALLLLEGFTELARNGPASANDPAATAKFAQPEFAKLLQVCLQQTKNLREGLRQELDPPTLDTRLANVKQACTACHHRFRD